MNGWELVRVIRDALVCVGCAEIWIIAVLAIVAWNASAYNNDRKG
jgi:hypothetical protein